MSPQPPRPGRRTSRRRPVVSLSGPDGAGKTTVLRSLVAGLRSEGFAIRAGYAYGCVLCRHIDRPSGVAGATVGGSGRQVRRPPVARPPVKRRVYELLRRLHGHMDAWELTLRLTALQLPSPWRAPAVVLTDRGPLDGLAKFNPPPRSRLARQYLHLVSRYDLVVLLDAPAEVLAQRDGEHFPEELEQWRMLYRRWTDMADAAGTRVFVVNTESRAPDSIASDLVRAITSARSGSSPPADAVGRSPAGAG